MKSVLTWKETLLPFCLGSNYKRWLYSQKSYSPQTCKSFAEAWPSEGPNFWRQKESGRGKAVPYGGREGQQHMLVPWPRVPVIDVWVGMRYVASIALTPAALPHSSYFHPHFPFREPGWSPACSRVMLPSISSPAHRKSSLSSIPQLTREHPNSPLCHS